jgi:DNA-binding beta-propeller fold protein YncE
MLALPGGAAAATVTVGPQSLTGATDYVHCASCETVISPTALTTPGDRAQVPQDGKLVAWRVLGACVGTVNCTHVLRVLRASGGGQFQFVGTGGSVFTATSCDPCANLDGTAIPVSPALTVRAGDYIAVDLGAAGSTDARVQTAPATGAATNVFSGFIADGSSSSPVGAGSNYEALFNADVVLDAPVLSEVAPASGSTGGGQLVTISGDHLVSALRVRFGDVDASCFVGLSDTAVAAVTPAHAAGDSDVAVTTPGGTTSATSADRFTFAVAPPGGEGGASSVYVADTGGATVSQYDRCAGWLAAKAPATVAAGAQPRGLAISPDGRSVYVANFTGASVSQYHVGAGGMLTPMTPPTVATGSGPRTIAVSPDGASAYVVVRGAATVAQYDIDADGRLTAKTPAAVPTGTVPEGVALSPDGHSAYVTNAGADSISQYDVDSGGRLTAKSLMTVASGPGPWAIALTPDGRNAYVSDLSGDSVSQYDIGPGGLLAPKTPATVAAGSAPSGLAVSPDGRSVYVADNGSDSVSQYDIGPGGLLAPKAPATMPAGSFPSGVAVSTNGRTAYVTNANGGSVSQYDAGPGGVLTPKTPATVTAGSAPRGIAQLPDQPPTADFAASIAAAGAATAFDGSASSDPDGTVTRYAWDFGDGAAAADAGPAPGHRYAAAGTYAVTLTVTDDAGCATGFVFTGQTAFCNGGPGARTTHTLTVPKAAGGGATPPAKASFAGTRASITVDRKGRFRFTFRATPGLKGSAVFKSVSKVRISRKSKRKRRVTLAHRRFTVPAGGTVTLRLRLSRTNLRILKLNRRIRTRVTVTLTNAAGLSSASSTVITLRAPKRRHA